MGVSHRDFLEHCKRVAKFCYSLLFLPCKHTQLNFVKYSVLHFWKYYPQIKTARQIGI